LDGWRGVATNLNRSAVSIGTMRNHPVHSAGQSVRSRPSGTLEWLILWLCDAPARTRCGGCLSCRLANHRCGCSRTRRPRCWPE
jgi:hypothetical protein